MSRKLRVLCLHGFTQTGELFRLKIGSLRTATKAIADYTCPDGPFAATRPPMHMESSDESSVESGKAWCTYTIADNVHTYHGVSETLNALDKLFADDVFDGIIGFSQGAMFAALVCTMPERYPLRFGMFFSGFLPSSPAVLETYFAQAKSHPLELPTLHVFGKSDEIITPERSRELAQSFDKAELLEHIEGHHIPMRSEYKSVYVNFLRDQHENLRKDKEEMC